MTSRRHQPVSAADPRPETLRRTGGRGETRGGNRDKRNY